MSVLPLKSVEDTSLWKLLEQDSGENKSISQTLAVNLKDICEEASERVKSFSALHSQYTLHDQVHFLRVTELMYRVMPEKVRRELNPVEIALLILTAFFHDQGMVLEADEFRDLKNRPDFRVHRENWKISHPNWGDLEARLKDRNISETERQRLHEVQNELESAHLTDYVRESHGERSAQFVRDKYSQDRQWKVSGRNLADLVAKLSQSHVQPATDLTESNGFHYDETVGTFTVNMVYLALVLRLADILDFDRDRTPESLYRTIDFRSNVSLREWANHRSVNGWIIEPNLIRFSMECEHPEYQRAALRFMDWIDKELSDAHAMTAKFYPPFNRYYFELPYLVDRSRIIPKNNAYIYHDLEFSLSRNEVVNLLMTDELYGSPSLCIRELVQNSMDALRHRAAIFERDNGMKWTAGKVTMIHELDEHGHEVVRCVDNGIGMTQEIIEKFLTNVGRSYYRSPEWEQERNSLRAAGIDFDPCSQFGIGFMSCFMLGDRIKIETRRDQGDKGRGEPLIIEISGIGGLVVVRQGKPDQPIGTTISITGRRKPRYLDSSNDIVQLVPTLKAYILNCEFSVIAHCEVDGIRQSIEVPIGFEKPVGQLRGRGLNKIFTIEKRFSDVSRKYVGLLDGMMVADFIVNDQGELTLENEEAAWNNGREMWGLSIEQKNPVPDVRKSYPPNVRIALNGIYVMGCAGRGEDNDYKWYQKYIYDYEDLYSCGSDNYGICEFDYLIDVRGRLKMPLKPSRHPKEKSLHGGNEVDKAICLTRGKIWSQVLRREECNRQRELVWSLSFLYKTDLCWISVGDIYRNIALPLVGEKGERSWAELGGLRRYVVIYIEVSYKKREEVYVKNTPLFYFDDKRYINLFDWIGIGCPSPEESLWRFADILGSVSSLCISENMVSFMVKEPVSPTEPIVKSLLSYPKRQMIAMSYDVTASSFISVHSDFPLWSVNKNHPLVQKATNEAFRWSISDQLPEKVLYILCNPNNESYLVDSPESLPRWMIEVAFQILETDWGSLEVGLAPPYKVRLMNGTEVTLTLETFENWTHATPLANE